MNVTQEWGLLACCLMPSSSLVHGCHSVRVPIQRTPIEQPQIRSIEVAPFMRIGLPGDSAGSSSCQPADQDDDKKPHGCDRGAVRKTVSLTTRKHVRRFTANMHTGLSITTHCRWKYSKTGNGVKQDTPMSEATDALDRPQHSAAPCPAVWSSHQPVPPGSSPWNFFSLD